MCVHVVSVSDPNDTYIIEPSVVVDIPKPT